MIFGRKRKQDAEQEQQAVNEEATVDAAAEEQAAQDESPQLAALRKAEAQWLAWDNEFEREEWGPFDIEEVDLDADDVKRLDLGSLVLTPFPDMHMQISVNKQQVPQAIIVRDEESAIEVALFGAPLRSSYIPEVRREMIAASQGKSSRITMRRGPFGTEMQRAYAVQLPDGKVGTQVTRTWLAEGPSWVLRGVVFGRAAQDIENEEATVKLTEFFANLVVRRGTDPVAPGASILFHIPEAPEGQEPMTGDDAPQG